MQALLAFLWGEHMDGSTFELPLFLIATFAGAFVAGLSGFAFGLVAAQDTNLPDASRQRALADCFAGVPVAATGVTGVADLAGVTTAFDLPMGALAEATFAVGVVPLAEGPAIAPRLKQVNATARGTSRTRRMEVLRMGIALPSCPASTNHRMSAA